MSLDTFDISILSALSRDASQSNAEIGDVVGLTHSTVARRITRMKADGIIKAESVEIDWKKLGLFVQATVLVRRSRSVPKDVVWSNVKREPHIISCRLVSGQHDLILEVVAKDLESYGRFVSDRLLNDMGIESVESLIVLSQIKCGPPDIAALYD